MARPIMVVVAMIAIFWPFVRVDSGTGVGEAVEEGFESPVQLS